MIDPGLRLPPQNLDAEKSLIASMLLDATVLDETSIRPEQFYSDAMARIFQAMQRMRRAGTPIDTVTLAEELIAAGQLENVGGLAVMAELLDTVTHSAHASYYAALIAEK